jgi:hypothetical protein
LIGGHISSKAKKSKKSEVRTVLQLVVEITEGLNQEAMEEWEAYREEDLKKPLTPRAKKMVQKKLMQWGHNEQMRLVELAIENNWRGIHYQEPPRQHTSTKTSSLSDDLHDLSWAK